MAKLIIIRGIPGSGKSTYARALIGACQKKGLTVAHFEADMFFTGEDGIYRWDPERIGQAHRWCQEQVRDALRNCAIVIVSNTSVRKKDVDTYVGIAEDAGAEWKVYRMRGRYTNVHNVPPEVVQRMRDAFEDYPGETLVPEDMPS